MSPMEVADKRCRLLVLRNRIKMSFLAVCLTVQAHTIFLEGQMGSDFYVVVRGAVVLEGTSRKTGAVVEVGTAERVSS